MRAKEYRVLELAVEQGVHLGWTHAHKHVDNPDAEAVQRNIVGDVLTEICEWFEFEPEVEE